MPNKMKKILIISVIVVVLGIAAYFLFFRKKKSEADSPEAKPDAISSSRETTLPQVMPIDNPYYERGDYNSIPANVNYPVVNPTINNMKPPLLDISQAERLINNISIQNNPATLPGQGKGGSSASSPLIKILKPVVSRNLANQSKPNAIAKRVASK